MRDYFRPLPQFGPARPAEALTLAGGWCWFDRVEVLSRTRAPDIIPARDAPARTLARLTAPRAPVAGLAMDRPRLMGILNLTPDSFSDGGRFNRLDAAMTRLRQMVAEGADILDIGGESTRPGAEPVRVSEEIARTIPVLKALREAAITTPVSLDTRKARVASEGIWAGAAMINDVSAMTYDPDMGRTVINTNLALCLMHAQGDPRHMQKAPRYHDVLLDVYDFLEEKADEAEAAGAERGRIVLDPGIGFGKRLEHNLALLARIGLFHGLGCALLLGASRKRFIGTIGGAAGTGDAADADPETPAEIPAEIPADARAPGSVAVALAAIAQGVQIIRAHDIGETAQAMALWRAATTGRWEQ